jgi:hypothetical protein
MIPFGKQQEILRDFSMSSPEELSGNCRETVYKGGVVVITNESRPMCSDFWTPKAQLAG